MGPSVVFKRGDTGDSGCLHRPFVNEQAAGLTIGTMVSIRLLLRARRDGTSRMYTRRRHRAQEFPCDVGASRYIVDIYRMLQHGRSMLTVARYSSSTHFATLQRPVVPLRHEIQPSAPAFSICDGAEIKDVPPRLLDCMPELGSMPATDISTWDPPAL